MFALAQERGNHLEPVEGFFDMHPYLLEYYSNVRELLFNELSEYPEIRFQIFHSYAPEEVLDIDFDSENEKYYLIYHRCKRNISSSEKWRKVQVERYITEIDKESVEIIKSLFDIAIMQTRFPADLIIGNDGTTYYFSTFRFGLISGKVWSPPEGSNMKKLVEIGYDLIALAKSNGVLVKIDTDLRTKIENLVNDLK